MLKTFLFTAFFVDNQAYSLFTQRIVSILTMQALLQDEKFGQFFHHLQNNR